MTIQNSVKGDWAIEQRKIWSKKAGLRQYYEGQIFNRVREEIEDGRLLQLGAGAGFFSGRGKFVNTDLEVHSGIDVVTDAHQLSFRNTSFSSVVGIDVLHHLSQPGRALAEWARVLSPGGRIVLVEPWAGPFGRLVYRYLHHEDCVEVRDPWNDAFSKDKDPMDGNGYIAYSLFRLRASEITEYSPALRLAKLTTFGGFSYLLTGGFQPFGFPASIVKAFVNFEEKLPKPVMAWLALRVMVVLEKEKF